MLGQALFAPEDAVLLMLIITLSIAIPSAPAALGLFEAGIVAYLTQHNGIGNELALAAAVVFHVAVAFPQVLLMGGVMLIHRKRKRP